MSAADQRRASSRSPAQTPHPDPSRPEVAAPPPSRDWSWLALGCGLVSVTWAIVMMIPGVANLPAWPAVSVGLFALVFSRAPGRPLPRGIGAFLGVVGLLVGLAKILALWGLLELLGLTVSHM